MRLILWWKRWKHWNLTPGIGINNFILNKTVFTYNLCYNNKSVAFYFSISKTITRPGARRASLCRFYNLNQNCTVPGRENLFPCIIQWTYLYTSILTLCVPTLRNFAFVLFFAPISLCSILITSQGASTSLIYDLNKVHYRKHSLMQSSCIYNASWPVRLS